MKKAAYKQQATGATVAPSIAHSRLHGLLYTAQLADEAGKFPAGGAARLIEDLRRLLGAERGQR